ncbi:MAG: calcium/sodium antiporter [Gemmatimonadetes bacterium]|nr:calcium/sodium antiporter [Gemmatimonadota bacterium]MDA1102014.1 calcium/sodium antiporter [Gemmatimonadota bacterium]
MPDLVLDVALMALGVGVLYFGAEWLVRGSARLAATLGVTPIVVGLTVVSFGTSAPELVVSVVAAYGGNSDLALGNIMGSNLANIGLILGLTAIVRPLDVQARVVWREMPLMLLVTVALYPLVWDLRLSGGDGVLLLMALAAYLVFVFQSVGEEAPQILGEYESFMKASVGGAMAHLPDVMWVIAGSGCLVLGGYCIVEGAVQVAGALGLSQVVIGLTVVAVGTSLPELATSLVAAVRRESDIAVGNVIGSNIFNVAGILGVTSVIEPLVIPSTLLTRELPAVLFISVLLFPVLRSGWRIRRWEGAILLGAYIGATVYLI